MSNREHAHPQWVNGRSGLDDPGRTSPDDDEAQEADRVHAGTPYQPAGQTAEAEEEAEELEDEDEDDEDDEDEDDDADVDDDDEDDDEEDEAPSVSGQL
jgi:ribonuclease E